MPDNLQTIPAKHGTATFVPRGHTIKIVNTYGKQIIETWAFALHQPPEENPEEKGEDQAEDEPVDNAEGKAESKNEQGTSKPTEDAQSKVADNAATAKTDAKEEMSQDNLKKDEKVEKNEENSKQDPGHDAPDPDIEAPEDTKDETKASGNAAATGKGWSSYIPSIRRTKTAAEESAADTSSAEPSTQDNTGDSPNAAQKKPWSSYLPYAQRKDAALKSQETESTGKKKGWSSYLPHYHPSSTTDNTNSSKKSWSSYMPSGQGFSSYLPSREAVASFTAAHSRDPAKSYPEQLYDFSKTPVGAGLISYATGSGYSSTIYSAYKAYEPPKETPPPTEYLSLAHTREESSHLSPQKGDTLFTNLRRPVLTLLEDTSAGGHATLVAACDPARAEAGGDGWEDRGSCAENLVMALRALNENIGLTGASAIGADISVQIAPAPLCLFLQESVGPGTLKRKEPDKRGVFVRFQALRDCVIVMSDCPQRGDASKVAHFVVQEGRIEGEEEDGAVRSIQKGREANEKAEAERAEKIGETDVNMNEEKASSSSAKPQQEGPTKDSNASTNKSQEEEPKKEKKKPRKLQRRNTGSQAGS